MWIFLTGVSCVGKTTIGAKLAALLGMRFFDLNLEIEDYFAEPIGRIQQRLLTSYSYRKEASRALSHVLSRESGSGGVMALPPSGLRDNFWKVVKKAEAVIVVLEDRPGKILERITFYDLDSRPIVRQLTDKEKRAYLSEIRKDITFFRKSYQRADLTVNIAGRGPDEAAQHVNDKLDQAEAMTLLKCGRLPPR